MSIWAKLQSWLGASASDVAIDNEFNNIYLGLNEAANGSRPSGYNDVRFTSSTNQLTIKGETKVGLLNVDLNSTITVSGLAGWRYVVSTNGGVVSVESIPPAEIVSDVIQYTPTPVFNSTLNGYYSTINPARRIIGIGFFDGTNLLEVISYGHGSKKNDSLYRGVGGSYIEYNLGGRLPFNGIFTRSRGDVFTVVDYGAGNTDAKGVRVTILKNCKISIRYLIQYSATNIVTCSFNKNGAFFGGGGGAVTSSIILNSIVNDLAVAGDIYTIYTANLTPPDNAVLTEVEVIAEEL